jgi:hypothetical protein
MEIGGRTVTSKENQEAKGKVAANVVAKYKRKKFARHLHQTLFHPPLPVQFGHFSIIVSLFTHRLLRRSESQSLINQAKRDGTHIHRALGTRAKSSTTLPPGRLYRATRPRGSKYDDMMT